MILSLPGGCIPKSAAWSLEHNVGVNQGPLGNTIQRIHRDGGRWRADVTFPTMEHEQGALFAAYLDKAARGDAWTYINPPFNDARGNWGPDELVVNGELTRGLTGWAAGTGAALNVNARRLRVKVGGSPGAIATAVQSSLGTEVDQPHVFMVDLGKGSTANWRIRIYPTGSPSQDEHVSYYEDEGRVIFTHIPETSSTTLELACNSTTEQDYCYFSNISAARCLLVNDSLAVGNACGVKGGPTSTFAALKAGEFVTIQLWNGWQMVRLTEDLDTDSSGNGTLRFEPSLRDGVKGGGAVVVHKPFCRMLIPAHASPHAVDMPRLFGFSVSYLEDVTEIGIEENPQDTDLIWYWDAHSYSLAPSIGTGTPTMTNGSKTYTDQSGILKTTDFNTADTASPSSYKGAFDHNSGGALKGQLIEGARTNSVLRSEDFATTWAIARSSISINQTMAPDGTATADKLIEDTTASNNHYVTQAVTTIAGTVYTFSVFAKGAERRVIELAEASALKGKRFGLDGDGSVAAPQASGITESGVIAASIQKLDDGWYRCSMTFMAVDATGDFRVILNDGSAAEYTGDGAAGAYLWGAQLEAGPFPTSYIPTTSAAVTRAADVDTLATNLIAGFSQTEGTVLIEATPGTPTNNADSQVFFDLSDATLNERITGYRLSTTGVARLDVVDGGASQAGMAGAALARDAPARVAYGWKVNQFTLSPNGAAETTDNAGTIPTFTALSIGKIGASNDFQFNGHFLRLVQYKTAKPRRQVRSLSA